MPKARARLGSGRTSAPPRGGHVPWGAAIMSAMRQNDRFWRPQAMGRSVIWPYRADFLVIPGVNTDAWLFHTAGADPSSQGFLDLTSLNCANELSVYCYDTLVSSNHKLLDIQI